MTEAAPHPVRRPAESGGADGAAVLLIPGTPLLVTGVDVGEGEDIRSLRAAVHAALAAGGEWTILVDDPSAEPILSLGGMGVLRGARAVPDGAGAVLVPCDGNDLVAAVRAHRAAGAPDPAPTLGTVVAALTALDAGCAVRLARTGNAGGPLEPASATAILASLDHSAAADPDGPLAPAAGAADFDDALAAALLGDTVDPQTVASLAAQAEQRTELAASAAHASAALSAIARRHPSAALRPTTIADARTGGVRLLAVRIDAGPAAEDSR